jgi:malate dehydrogenase (oxaloacetate-decarboxylating)
VHSKVDLRDRDDPSGACTPGVTRVCPAIAADPADARRLTIKRDTVRVRLAAGQTMAATTLVVWFR